MILGEKTWELAHEYKNKEYQKQEKIYGKQAAHYALSLSLTDKLGDILIAIKIYHPEAFEKIKSVLQEN